MKAAYQIGMVIYLGNALWMLILGLVYLFHKKVLPYHQKALSETWEELSPNLQTLLNTLVRAIGITTLVSGAALCLIIWFPFRRQEPWAIGAVPALFFLYLILIRWIASHLSAKTPGGPSLRVNGILLVSTMIAFGLSLLPTR